MRRFLYYILKEDGRSGRVVNGVVSYTGTKTPLPETPDGWQSLALAWERNFSDYGITLNYSLPFGFVLNGKKIVRDALYNESIEEKIFLLIQELKLIYTIANYEWRYNYLYKGEIDLSAAEDSLDMINVPCMEGGLAKLLKANRNTKYTFPFDTEAITIQLDGIALQENANYVAAGVIDNDVFSVNHTIPITFVNKDGISVGVGFFSQMVEDITPSFAAYVAASTNYFIINDSTIAITYNLKGHIDYMATSNDAIQSYRWRLVKQDDSRIDIYNEPSAIPVGVTNVIDIDETFTLNPGERMFLIGTFYAGSGGTIIVVDYLDSSELNLTFESTQPATNIKAYKKSTLFSKLIGKVAGDESFASSQLCEDWDFIPLTSGDAIRGLTDATITTSLEDFYKDIDATAMAGISVFDDKIEIEDRRKYFDNSNPIDLGIIKDLQIAPATDLICNKFKSGHVKPDIEDINGKYDPNGSSVYSGPYTKVVKDYSIISPYKAGPYEIESLRLNLDGKVTTDDNRDNDVYAINCILADVIQTVLLSFVSSGNYLVFPASPVIAIGTKFMVTGTVSNNATYEVTNVVDEGATQTVYTNIPITVAEFTVLATVEFMSGQVFELNRPAYTLLEGVPNDTIFNIENLTPKRMLLQHKDWWASMHYGLYNKSLIFNSGDKNTSLITELAGVTIDEDADEPIADANIMFLPFYFSFGTEVPVDLPAILEATPNRCFSFEDESGNEFEGFLVAAAIAPNDLKEQEFRLLATPNNNLSLLV